VKKSPHKAEETETGHGEELDCQNDKRLSEVTMENFQNLHPRGLNTTARRSTAGWFNSSMSATMEFEIF
jgi:hypothetical protein